MPEQKVEVSVNLEPPDVLSTSLKSDSTAKLCLTLSNPPKSSCTSAPIIKESARQSPRGKTDKMFINGAIRTVGTDPAFVENYFKSSRLSFIGSYKQRIPNASKKKEGLDIPSVPAHARRFVYHVDMDQFFAAVVLRKYPQYRNSPVAISHLGMDKGQQLPDKNNVSFKNSTSECATANYEARKYGIRKGMFLSAAYERK
jgi:DNA repair protein REV1